MARNVPLISGAVATVAITACFVVWPLETVFVCVLLVLALVIALFGLLP